MIREQLAAYLDELRAHRVRSARIKFPDGAELAVDFEPEMPEWPTEAPAPEPGGWKAQ